MIVVLIALLTKQPHSCASKLSNKLKNKSFNNQKNNACNKNIPLIQYIDQIDASKHHIYLIQNNSNEKNGIERK